MRSPAALAPSTTKLLSAAALEAGTGVSIGSLTGAATRIFSWIDYKQDRRTIPTS